MAIQLVDRIIAYEQGDLDARETLELFGELIANGHAWSLQGAYGRAASSLIERGLIAPNGEVDWQAFASLELEA